MAKKNKTEQVTEIINPEHEKLLETLKFTPRTYKIQMWGYGGEYVMGTVDRKIYDYFKHRRLDLSDYAWDSDYAEEHNIPEEMQPFPPGSYYECDDMGHVHGVDRNAGTIQIIDEQDQIIYEKRLEDITGGDEDEPEWGGGEEVWIGSKPAGTVVFLGVSNEKGTFFEGEIPLTMPFDITRLTLGYDEFDGNDIINSVTYDGEHIDNWGGDTNGKSSEFGFYLVTDSNKWEKYCTIDDIEYSMTEWFPKKVKPAYVGNYMVRTAGKNSYTYQATWTGKQWVNQWTEEKDHDDPEKAIKIKEWQGLAQDPDAIIPPANIADALNTVFEAFGFEDAISELEKAVEELDEKVNGEEETKMSTWVLTTIEKKNAVETEFWSKDGKTIKRTTGFRWGKVYCESDERPDIDLVNPDGLEVFNTDYDFELDSLDDGCWADVEYPEDMSEEEQERMDELWDEEAYDGWEGEGWSNDDTETWFYGELSLEEE